MQKEKRWKKESEWLLHASDCGHPVVIHKTHYYLFYLNVFVLCCRGKDACPASVQSLRQCWTNVFNINVYAPMGYLRRFTWRTVAPTLNVQQ
jgi:hypothetical protein